MMRQPFWTVVVPAGLGVISVVVLNWLLHSGRHPWTRAGADMLMVQGVLAAVIPLVALPFVLFRRIRRAAGVVVVASLMLFLATALSAFIWASTPAHLSAKVINSSPQGLVEVLFVAGENTARFSGPAPREQRAVRFRVGFHEGSMAVRAKAINGEEVAADCNTYINWALGRASYDVEVSAANNKLTLRCFQREHELKF
jgi:hypothetical protein